MNALDPFGVVLDGGDSTLVGEVARPAAGEGPAGLVLVGLHQAVALLLGFALCLLGGLAGEGRVAYWPRPSPTVKVPMCLV
jgi:hypothetical protein